MKSFSRKQVAFIAKWTLAAAFDRIESNLPDTIDLDEYQANKNAIDSTITAAMDTAAMSLAIFFAQTTGQGMGIWDWSGNIEFHAAVEDFVAERTNPNWKGLKVTEPLHPDTTSFANMFADEWQQAMKEIK